MLRALTLAVVVLFTFACSGTPASVGGGSASNGGGSAGGGTASAGGGGGAEGGGSAGGGTSSNGGGTSSTGGGSAGGGSSSAGGGSAGGGSGPTDGGTDAGLTPAQIAMLAMRPYRFVVPNSYDGGTATPLVMLLHGYSANGQGQDQYFRFSQKAQDAGFLLATPDGTRNTQNITFWNATESCCNFYGSTVDDVAYLTAILDDVALKYRVDPKRVFLVGHSNGGFMSYRYACEKPERIAAIASLAGANWNDEAKCRPTTPFSVVQIHGTNDTTVQYGGGTLAQGVPPYPSALTSITHVAKANGCDGGVVDGGANLDLESVLAGAETRVAAYAGCPAGAAELWTIQNGSHVPSLGNGFADEVWRFLSAHPKP